MRVYKFEQNLEKIVKERKLKYTELAGVTGLASHTIYDWVKKRRMPNLFNAMLVADALNISLDELVYGEDRRK